MTDKPDLTLIFDVDRKPGFTARGNMQQSQVQLKAALEGLPCPKCKHLLKWHVGKLGCCISVGKRWGTGEALMMPCYCDGHGNEVIMYAIAALRNVPGFVAP